MIEFAGQMYPNATAIGGIGRAAAATAIQESNDPLGAASGLAGAVLALLPSADTPHADLPHLTHLVSLILKDGLAAHNRRLGITD